MIFRKPYGFLIRHFKFIHLILVGLYVYLAIKVNNMLIYYNRFISNSIGKIEAVKYINNYYIFIVMLSVFICAIVYWLMKYKKKPRLLYIILIILYLVVGIIINTVQGGLHSIYVSVLDTKTLRLYRDLLQIMLFAQIGTIVIVSIRALGFDIKKFNFVQDLQELNIDVSDEEEVELTLGSTNNIQRNAHRGFREFKYYYFENKVFINIIVIVIIAFLVSGFFINKEIVNKEYRENEVFSSDKYDFSIVNSYITNKDYSNTIISYNDTVFVIIKMNINSKEGKVDFNTANLILKIGNHNYVTDSRLSSRFVDLGNVYTGQSFSGSNTYLFIYNIPVSEENDKMKIIYAGNKIVNLDPVYLDKNSNENKYSIGDVVDFTKSSFGYGSFMIKSFEMNDKFTYPYDYVVSGKKYTSNLSISSNQNIIMHLVINSSYPYNFDNYFVLSTYAKLKYKIGDTEYSSSSFGNKTPGTYKDGLYLAVDKNIVNASNIWLEINIRNSKFIYTLK